MKSVFALLLSSYLIATTLIDFTQSKRSKRQVFYPYGNWWPGYLPGLAYYRSDNTGSSNACRNIKCQQNEECHVQQVGFGNGTTINQTQCVPKLIPVPAVRSGATSIKCGDIFCKATDDCHVDHWIYRNGTKLCFSRCFPPDTELPGHLPISGGVYMPPIPSTVYRISNVKGHPQSIGTQSPTRPLPQPKPEAQPRKPAAPVSSPAYSEPIPAAVPEAQPRQPAAPVSSPAYPEPTPAAAPGQPRQSAAPVSSPAYPEPIPAAVPEAQLRQPAAPVSSPAYPEPTPAAAPGQPRQSAAPVSSPAYPEPTPAAAPGQPRQSAAAGISLPTLSDPRLFPTPGVVTQTDTRVIHPNQTQPKPVGQPRQGFGPPQPKPKPLPVPGQVRQSIIEVNHPRSVSAPAAPTGQSFRAEEVQPSPNYKQCGRLACKLSEECVISHTEIGKRVTEIRFSCVESLKPRAASAPARPWACGAALCNQNEHCRIHEVKKANGDNRNSFHCVSDTGVTRSYPNPGSRYRFHSPPGVLV